MKDGVMRIPSSHRYVKQPGKKHGFKPDLPPLRHLVLPTGFGKSKEAKVKKQKPKTLKYPKEAEIRQAARESLLERRTSSSIQEFGKQMRTYCAAVMGYRDCSMVEEYIYLTLMRLVEAKRAARKVSVTLEDLKALVNAVFADVEADILAMAVKGRRIKKKSNQGGPIVKATVGQRSGKTCYVILDADEKPLYVLALKTPGELNKTFKGMKPLKAKKQGAKEPPVRPRARKTGRVLH